MWSSPGFWLFDDERVVLETPTAELTITQPREVTVYAKVFAELASMAVYGAAARCMVTSAMRVLHDHRPVWRCTACGPLKAPVRPPPEGRAMTQLVRPGAEFRQLFRSFTYTAFRLEVRDRYNVGYEAESVRRFLAGEPDDLPWLQN